MACMACMACMAAVCPCRQRPGGRHRVAGRDQLLALQPGVDQVDDVVRQRGR